MWASISRRLHLKKQEAKVGVGIDGGSVDKGGDNARDNLKFLMN